MNNIEIVDVYMNSSPVGRIALTLDGLCGFEYDSEYLKSGKSISPYYLPIQSGLIIAKRDPFNGNFGVFNDSLPDGWGALLLDRFLQEKGIDPYKLTVLQRLSLIGSTGRGALEYRPDMSIATDNEFHDFDKLATEAEKLLRGLESDGSIDLLYRYGGSSRGQRYLSGLKGGSGSLSSRRRLTLIILERLSITTPCLPRSVESGCLKQLFLRGSILEWSVLTGLPQGRFIPSVWQEFLMLIIVFLVLITLFCLSLH